MAKETHPQPDFAPRLVSESAFERIKAASVRIYAYANRVLIQALRVQSRKDTGFALFDKDGYLLKLYGSEEYLDWCGKRGVQVRGQWKAAFWGETAVSRGLDSKQPEFSAGEEHANSRLRDVAIHFFPLTLERKGNETEYELLGGIASLSRAEDPLPEGKLICSSLAHDIILHMFMSEELYALYFQEPKGLMNIDINTTTGNPHILYHNEQVFRILGIPYEDLYFKKAESFFDPLPKNKEFWEIVRKKKTVEDVLLPLSIRGKQNTYLVSSVVYQQSHLGFGGIRFFLSTSRSLSNQVARHIGNNAVYSFSRILGDCPQMQRCIAQAGSIARSDSNVMITGESGVGKDVFAQAIHNASRRRSNPFIVLNCAAYPRDLLASELFGYEGGAYTGAKKNGNLGKFELADTGTIFLDEIGDMPLDLQVMLLRVIEQKSFMRMGSNVVRSVDVKIISATNADLRAMVEKRTFRPDLYFRLCTLNLRLPPLRERGQDIILLAEHFIRSITTRMQMEQQKLLSEESKELMLRLPWHGNVRELQNVMERVVQLIPHQVITPEDLELCLDFAPERPQIQAAPAAAAAPPSYGRHITREDILQALEGTRYNRTMAAAVLGISRKTFYRKLKELDIQI